MHTKKECKEQTKECKEQTEACRGEIQIEEEKKSARNNRRALVENKQRVVEEYREQHNMSHYNAYHNRFLFYISICKHLIVDLIVISVKP